MQDSFVTGLKRAYEMEERMATVLIDLCEPAITDADSQSDDLKKIHRMLLKIQKDTLRHKEVVLELLARFSKGEING